MDSVLGLSVGSSAVRIVRRDGDRPATDEHLGVFAHQTVEVVQESGEDLAAEAIGVVIAGDAGSVTATGVAYRDDAQASAICAAMGREGLRNYQLTPEPAATLALLRHTGEIVGHSTVVLYDLGSGGLTVSVVDIATGAVAASRRTDTIGGDNFDRLIREHQLGTPGARRPENQAEMRALDAQCRDAKEQLSVSNAVAVPGAAGLLLLSRETFESLIGADVESSARLVRAVVAESGRIPDAAVLIGGGAQIPLVQSILQSWLGLPVIVPNEPELVIAKGAALLARPVVVRPADDAQTQVLSAHAAPAHSSSSRVARPGRASRVGRVSPADRISSWRKGTAPRSEPVASRRQISGAGLAGGALVVVALIGLGLGAGNAVLGNNENTPSKSDPAEITMAPQTTAPRGPQAVVPEPAAARVPAPTSTQNPAATPTTVADESRRPMQHPAPPPPPPPPLIPGLPQVQLPQVQLPTLPPPPPLPKPELPQLPAFP